MRYAHLTVWNKDWELGGADIVHGHMFFDPEEIRKIIARMVGLGAKKAYWWVGKPGEGTAHLSISWQLPTCWLSYSLPYEVGR